MGSCKVKMGFLFYRDISMSVHNFLYCTEGIGFAASLLHSNQWKEILKVGHKLSELIFFLVCDSYYLTPMCLVNVVCY